MKISSSTPTNGLFKVQIGAFQDKANAENAMKKANASGFQTYLRQENNLYKSLDWCIFRRKNAEAVGLDAVIVIE